MSGDPDPGRGFPHNPPGAGRAAVRSADRNAAD